jgi:hypothetical protein
MNQLGLLRSEEVFTTSGDLIDPINDRFLRSH